MPDAPPRASRRYCRRHAIEFRLPRLSISRPIAFLDFAHARPRDARRMPGFIILDVIALNAAESDLRSR